MRATPPTRDGVSPVHSTVNRNKLSLGLNLKSAEGKKVMRLLLREADVFVEGFRPGAMSRLGFSFEAARRINPKLVYCSISAFGQGSRLSSMPGHDINFQAMAGALSHSAGRVPPLMLGDMASGIYAALGILGALARRGEAVHIDVPIVASILSLMVIPASPYLATGRPSRRRGLIFGSTPYYNLYRTSDGKFMAVAAIQEEFWNNLLEELGVPQMSGMRFGTPEEVRELTLALRRIFATRSRDEWARLLMHKDTCTTPVLTVEEALTGGWAKELSMLVDVAKGETRLNSPLTSRPAMRDGAFTRAPALGEDTDPLLRSLGYSEKQIRALRAKGAVE